MNNTGGQADEYQPRTALGRDLWEMRKQILAGDEQPLDAEGVRREVQERRGERDRDEG